MKYTLSDWGKYSGCYKTHHSLHHIFHDCICTRKIYFFPPLSPFDTWFPVDDWDNLWDAASDVHSYLMDGCPHVWKTSVLRPLTRGIATPEQMGQWTFHRKAINAMLECWMLAAIENPLGWEELSLISEPDRFPSRYRWRSLFADKISCIDVVIGTPEKHRSIQ